MTRRLHTLSLLTCATLWLLVGCSELILPEEPLSVTAESSRQDPLEGEGRSGDQPAEVGDDADDPTPETPLETPLEALRVDTGVEDDTPRAGDAVQVGCIVEGLIGEQVEPETSWSLVLGPSEGFIEPDITDGFITFKTVGTYLLSCRLVETGWQDPSPVVVKVQPGPATVINTEVTEVVLTAGDTTSVSCTGEDAFGNTVEESWTIAVTLASEPASASDGIEVQGAAIHAMVEGFYLVGCQQPEGLLDDTPVAVSVACGLPRYLVTELGQGTIVAGGSVPVTCRAEDEYGNSVPDFPFSVAPIANLSMLGLEATSTVAGTYVIQCVPGDLGEWAAFVLQSETLEVLPDAPVSLSLTTTPPKPYFAPSEYITLVAQARDQFDNLVSDVALAPLSVAPEGSFYLTPQDNVLAFPEDGVYEVSTHLLDLPEQVANVTIPVDGSPPSLTITHPARASTVKHDKPTVMVTGFANDSVTEIVEVRVNGEVAFLSDDGSFYLPVVPKWGLNVLRVEAEDTEGYVSTIIQSYYFAEHYHALEPQPAYVPDAIEVWLDETFIDDGVHTPGQPDDLAGILEAVVDTIDLNGLFSSSISVGLGYKLKVNGVNMSASSLNLKPVNGGLELDVDLGSISVPVTLEGSCKILFIDLCPDFSGSAHIDAVTFDAKVLMSATKGELSVGLANSKLEMVDLDVDIGGIIGWLFDWLIDFIVGLFAETIEDELEAQMSGLIASTLQQVTSMFSISQTIDLPALLPGGSGASATFDSHVWSLAFTNAGGQMGLASRVSTAKQVPYTVHGAIARGTCALGYGVNYTLPGSSEFEVALHDDLINQLLTAMWYTGGLEVTLDPDTVGEMLGGGGLDGFPLPVDGFGVRLSLQLPPIVNGCDPSGYLRVEIGGLFIELTIDSPLFPEDDNMIGIYASLALGGEISYTPTDEGTLIAVNVYGLEQIDYHWEFVPSFFAGNEALLEDLLEEQLLGDTIDGLFTEPLGNFLVPHLDLGSLSTLFPPGMVLKPEVELLTHLEGHTLLQGRME